MTTKLDILYSDILQLLKRSNLTTTRAIEDDEGITHELDNEPLYDNQLEEIARATIEKASDYMDDRPATEQEIINQFKS
jgi:hypothetical protein